MRSTASTGGSSGRDGQASRAAVRSPSIDATCPASTFYACGKADDAMTDTSKKPKPKVIECPTCGGSGTTTRRTVDGEVDDAECWKCLGIGWITQLPVVEGMDEPRPMPSEAEQARAQARGDGMQAEHTATLPNSVL